MHVSPFFHNLRSAYLAELDDMRHDSEGQFVLDRRLAERRSEVAFLVNMLEVAPEMVAVVLHKAFRFMSTQAMDRLLACEQEDLSAWETLRETIDIAPWALPTVQLLREQATGDHFLSIAAALEYMAGSSRHVPAGAGDEGDSEEDADNAEADNDTDDHQPLSADDLDDADGQTREEAHADW
ncbi:MAG: hypothetical protein EOO29_54920, partial [Comamonadaceae bacterium]